MSLDMYAEEILDHYRNPKNFGKLDKPDVKVRELNPLCGDQYEFQVKVSDGKITDVKFNGDGCAISTASASILSEFIKGKKISELKKMEQKDLLNLLGIEVSPARIKCAMLAFNIVKKVVEESGKKK
ncbi:MAG: SUF system NifU family Fe-S cluster assembly protein [Candidatus Aenigmarchaeota archaeon]|nr:SUF system NifU family Fe-S cluster assembly protein [Candidatus Aenigmarchaeota archaeon]